jgi:hypothetical protein
MGLELRFQVSSSKNWMDKVIQCIHYAYNIRVCSVCFVDCETHSTHWKLVSIVVCVLHFIDISRQQVTILQFV